jgi:MoxR-like ATPase
MNIEKDAAEFRAAVDRLRREVGRVIVGYESTVDELLVCLLAPGHALLEGVPGIGKTLFVRTLARVLDLEFRRIQFTPDLMPADITGTDVLESGETAREFRFREGPLFANLVLADEINRATPKTQSALLEAMQEGCVTIGGTRHPLPDPFLVFATQNPIEMEGTYPLPEAQLDRFTFKLIVPSPDDPSVREILVRTTGPPADPPETILEADTVRRFRTLVREIHVPEPVLEHVVRILRATHPDAPAPVDRVRRFVRFGASPRGGQAMILAGKVRALLAGRLHVSLGDVRAAAPPALRHRILLNFEGETEGISTDRIVEDVLAAVPETPDSVRGLVETLRDED